MKSIKKIKTNLASSENLLSVSSLILKQYLYGPVKMIKYGLVPNNIFSLLQ